MTRLVRPDLRYHSSWAEAVREFGDTAMHGSGLWEIDRGDLAPATLERHVSGLLAAAADVPLDAEIVPCTYFWIVDEDDRFVGYLALRHRLNERLLEEGGHIGYAVRPTRRREGHATAALRLALDESRELGLDRVLVTCDQDNDGSRRTIETCGGVLEDQRGVKRRYWIDLTG
ncbi:MAG: GNAT family N-acetyltransferase [Actinobacteria bacterium]|uniref:Unannotated protein n=1 Tax=freshwater metagenome TaxID=449393 RepID=A0A6J6QL45_9ZZZZ|nr:GNAT family N-acetyltransferase [Actinomycetota bacterium]